jgi:aspartyl-tRNA(Asn)/glutamyl-tRNA(Gln) amidotransferase subunit A
VQSTSRATPSFTGGAPTSFPSSLGGALPETNKALANIEKFNPVVNAMISVCAEAALARARELDDAAAEGRWCGLLHGMTVSVKDNVDVAGMATTAASGILRDNIASSDSFVVQRLLRNGAVIVGKANLHEWVFGPTSQSRHFGPVRNPWNTAHVSGGSSGGSGASVAAGMCVASIGSDTAGSIRLPAAFNGTAGLRPTVGRISSSGSLPVSAPFDTLGPLARRVSDVARVFAAIAGHDPHDPISVDRPVPEFLATLSEPVRGLRLGIQRRWFFEGLHPDIASAMERAIEVFSRLGVELVDIDLHDVENAQENLTFTVIPSDAMNLHAPRIASRAADYGDDVLMRMRIADRVTGVRYAQSLRWMEGWRHRLRGVFGKVDAILSPTTPEPAPSAEGLDFAEAIRRIPRFSCAWPAAGIPSLAVPCGITRDTGIPVSLELAGAWFDEPRLLQLGHAFQMATDHHLRTAPLVHA